MTLDRFLDVLCHFAGVEATAETTNIAPTHRFYVRRSVVWRETIGSGSTWAEAYEDAVRWWPMRSRIHACSTAIHRDVRRQLAGIIAGGEVTDPRAAHWMRTRRPWRGKGHLGECLCGSSFVVNDRSGDSSYASELAREIAAEHGVVEHTLFASNRDHKVVTARAELAKRLRMTGWSYPRIGAVLGRHHTSVMHLVKEFGR